MEAYISNFMDMIGYLLLIFLFIPRFLRRNNKLLSVSVFVIVLMRLFLLPFVTDVNVNLIINIVLCGIYVFMLSEETILLRILSVPLVISMEGLIYECAGFLLSIFLQQSAFWGTTGERNVLYSKFLAIGILLLFLVTLHRKNKYLSLTVCNKLIMILGSMAALIAVHKLEADTPFLYNSNASFYGLTYIIAVFVIYLYLFSVSEKNKLAVINKAQLQYIDALKLNYEAMLKNETRYRKFVHDVNNHVNVIERFIELGEYEQASSYIQTFQNNVPQKGQHHLETGNVLFNAILLDKRRSFPDVEIRISGRISDSLNISDYDMCTIVSNLLDNALEYSKRNDFPYIEINLFNDNNFVLVEFKNQVTSDFSMKHFGEKSTKRKQNHGFGISNVKDALSANQGKMIYALEDGFLSCKVFLVCNR